MLHLFGLRQLEPRQKQYIYEKNKQHCKSLQYIYNILAKYLYIKTFTS